MFQKEVEFLGKIVSSRGISISPTKTEAVKNWPVPTNPTELLSFHGYLNYHRDHIQNYGDICAPLYDLANAKGIWAWNTCHKEAFEQAKMALCSAPCLSYPDHDGLFVLDTDASDRTIGAVQEGKEKVICYASHVLLKPQRQYCTTRKDLLAVVKFCRHFRHYLLGRRFLLRTDHNSLIWLMRFKHIEGQLVRWLEEQYNMEIVHRPGKKHTNADDMSRLRDVIPECDCYNAGARVEDLPCEGCRYCQRAHVQWGRFSEDVDDVVPLANRSSLSAGPVLEVRAAMQVDENFEPGGLRACNWAVGNSPAEVRSLQEEDPDLCPIIKWLECNIELKQAELRLQSPVTRTLWLSRKKLQFIDRVLHYKWDGKTNRSFCLVHFFVVHVAQGLQRTVLHGCHDLKSSGHLGQQKTL